MNFRLWQLGHPVNNATATDQRGGFWKPAHSFHTILYKTAYEGLDWWLHITCRISFPGASSTTLYSFQDLQLAKCFHISPLLWYRQSSPILIIRMGILKLPRTPAHAEYNEPSKYSTISSVQGSVHCMTALLKPSAPEMFVMSLNELSS